MNIQLAEESIEAKLVADLDASKFTIDLLPESDEDYTPAKDKTYLSVCYRTSDFNKPKSTGLTVQEEAAVFEIIIRSKKLRGAGGLWDAYRVASNSLIGFCPTNCRRISAVKFEFEKREGGVFSYVYSLTCGSELVQDFTEPITQTIVQVTHNSPTGYEGTVTTFTPPPEPEEPEA